jgi:transcriptional regulator GlxA family with amidase domain
MTDLAPRTLGAVFYPQFELLDTYGPLEMFGTLGQALRIVTVAEKPGPVKSFQGPSTVAEYGFADAPRLDLVLVPGGVGTFPQLENAAMLEFLRKRSSEAQVMMSVCTGSALYAKAGLLDGRRATTNKQFFDITAQHGPRTQWVREARWVEDGAYVTSSGVSAGMDMALAVIAKLYGREAAQTIADLTEYEWHTDAARDPFSRFLNQGRMGPELSRS